MSDGLYRRADERAEAARTRLDARLRADAAQRAAEAAGEAERLERLAASERAKAERLARTWQLVPVLLDGAIFSFVPAEKVSDQPLDKPEDRL